jgi:hypothetical protein
MGAHDERLTVGWSGQIKAVLTATAIHLQLRSVDL